MTLLKEAMVRWRKATHTLLSVLISCQNVDGHLLGYRFCHLLVRLYLFHIVISIKSKENQVMASAKPIWSLAIILIMVASSVVDGYKILLFTSTISKSHQIFYSRIGDLLTDAGNDVLYYMPLFHPNVTMAPTKKCRVLQVSTASYNDSMYVYY